MPPPTEIGSKTRLEYAYLLFNKFIIYRIDSEMIKKMSEFNVVFGDRQ